jgi:serine/threonine protein kinase
VICPDLDLLDRWAADELDATTRASIDEHVTQCEDCSRRASDVALNLELAGNLARPSTPARPALERIGGYRILRELGRGGMGVVYEAEQESPRRRVAVKLLRSSSLEGAEADRLLRREARALARLVHPGIATIHEAGRLGDGRSFVVMQLVNGVPLTAFATAHELTLDQRLALFTEVARAIAHAHQRGVIHRDLKPSNVLVEESGEERIAGEV